MERLSDPPRVSFARAHPSQASRTERAASCAQPVLCHGGDREISLHELELPP